MPHTLFTSPLVTRQCNFDVPLPSPPRQSVTWPVADAPNPWSIEEGIKDAHTLCRAHQMTQAKLIQRRLEPKLHGFISPQEGAFWLSLATADFFAMSTTERRVLDESWVKEHAHQVDPISCSIDDPWVKALIDSLTTRGSMSQEQRCTVMMRSLRAVIPYLDLLAYLLEHNKINFLTHLGAPTKACQQQALALMEPHALNMISSVYAWVDINTSRKLAMMASPAVIQRIKEFIPALVKSNPSRVKYLSDLYYFWEEEDAILNLFKTSGTQGTGHDLKMFLTHFGFKQMEIFSKHIVNVDKKNHSHRRSQLQLLYQVTAPEIPEVVFSLKDTFYFKEDDARAYCTQDDIAITAGLLAMCHGRGKRRLLGLQHLKAKMSQHQENETAYLTQLLGHCTKPVQTLIQKELLPSSEAKDIPTPLPREKWTPWMHRFEALIKGREPEHILGESYDEDLKNTLANIFVGGHQQEHLFPERVILGLLWAYKTNDTEALEVVDTHAFAPLLHPLDMEEVCLLLLQSWRRATYPEEGAWVTKPLADFGAVKSVQTLQPHIKMEKNAAEAVAMIDCLWKMNRLDALDQLKRWQPRHSYADELLNRLVKERGLDDLNTLKEFFLPSFGLDHKGERSFDYGSRKITMMLHGPQEIHFRDTAGKKYRSIPPVKAEDDQGKAMVAKDTCKKMLTTLRTTIKLQLQHFHNATFTQHSWSPKGWWNIIGRHPVRSVIAKGLVWGIYTEKGNLTHTAITDGDGSFVTLDSKTVKLQKHHRLSPIHTLQLSPKKQRAWLEMLAEFEIIQPFKQLERPTHKLNAKTLATIKQSYTQRQSIGLKNITYDLDLRAWQWTRQTKTEGPSFTLTRQITQDSLTLFLELPHRRKRIDRLEYNGQVIEPTKEGLSVLPKPLFCELYTLIHVGQKRS